MHIGRTRLQSGQPFHVHPENDYSMGYLQPSLYLNVSSIDNTYIQLAFVYCRVLEAPSASQQVNRKDTRLEASGQNKSYDIHIENFDVSYGDKYVWFFKSFLQIFIICSFYSRIQFLFMIVRYFSLEYMVDCLRMILV